LDTRRPDALKELDIGNLKIAPNDNNSKQKTPCVNFV
jgi:hypothetical protein